MAENIRTEIVTLCETVNKYHPGTHAFFLDSLMPLASSGAKPVTTPNVISNLANEKDTKEKIKTKSVTQGSTISLFLPKEHTRWYPVKYIPAGTKFVISFIGNDIGKAKIIGRL